MTNGANWGQCRRCAALVELRPGGVYPFAPGVWVHADTGRAECGLPKPPGGLPLGAPPG